MKKNIDRLRHFGTFRSPTPDEEGYQAFMDISEKNLRNNPKQKKELDKRYRQVQSIAYTQAKNGIGLLQDKELRFFHAEFNDRVWRYGFGSMPSAFNILEGFFKWNPMLFYFELIEEEEHLFSLYDFFDFVTSNNCSNSLNHFVDTVEDEVIYSYNILNDVKDLTFSTTDSKKYVIGGISFVKRANEVFILMIAGELGDNNEFTTELPDIESGTSGRTYIKPADDRKTEIINLFDIDGIWKVNVYARIDLDSRTIDSRYIQKDIGNGFTTITDDYGMLQQAISDKEVLERLQTTQLEEISKYDAIFEAAYSCLYLPEYLDFFDAQVLSEEHPSSLFNETIKKHINKSQTTYNPKYFFKTKDVWVLDRDIDPKSGKIRLKTTELKIEKTGYWKQLKPGEVGTDKQGKAIHSRTWVEETLAWHQLIEDNKEVELTINEPSSAKSGYIYLLRNPAHELNLFKIGLTTNTVEERAQQLSGTSSPDKFVIINRWQVKDCVLAEKQIHQTLDKYRLNPKREFFKISIEEAIKYISPIIEKINQNGP